MAHFRVHYFDQESGECQYKDLAAGNRQMAVDKISIDKPEVEVLGVEKKVNGEWELVMGRRPGPLKFVVKGVNRETSEDVSIQVEADSKENAQVKARLMNVEPTEVRGEFDEIAPLSNSGSAGSPGTKGLGVKSVGTVAGGLLIVYLIIYVLYGEAVKESSESLLRDNGISDAQVVRADYGAGAPLSRRSEVSIVVRSRGSQAMVTVRVSGNPTFSRDAYIQVDGLQLLRLRSM